MDRRLRIAFGPARRCWSGRLGAALSLLVLLAACDTVDSAGNLLSGRKPRPPDPATAQANRYEQALRYKAEGDCVRAMPLFEPFAASGKGNEVAQLQLGECYLDRAKTAVPAESASKMRETGAGWILKAANSNVPKAQEEAARLALDGTGVAADPAEAGKWFLVLQRNPMRSVVGPVQIDPELQQLLHERLSDADWRVAERRASQWQPVEQAATPPPKKPQRPADAR
ncbi:MAG TPA: hypothetical protein VEU47_10635 [Candidatus Cybelea sp.]|nr:hypothetical protein [Candidatus Cybelea sp.]